MSENKEQEQAVNPASTEAEVTAATQTPAATTQEAAPAAEAQATAATAAVNEPAPVEATAAVTPGVSAATSAAEVSAPAPQAANTNTVSNTTETADSSAPKQSAANCCRSTHSGAYVAPMPQAAQAQQLQTPPAQIPQPQAQPAAMPAYPQPYAHNQNGMPVAPAGYVVQPQNPGNGMAITSLVTGIVGFLFTILVPFGTILAIISIVFGCVAAAKKQSKAMWITGLILSGLSLLGLVIMIFFYFMILGMVSDPDMQMLLLENGLSPEQLDELLYQYELLNS